MASKSPTDPCWQYVTAALERAAAVSRKHGYAWRGSSCGVVSYIALMCIMWNRNWDAKKDSAWAVDGLPPITTKVGDINLAYADHYLDRRTNCGLGMGQLQATIQMNTYDAVKKVAVGFVGMKNHAGNKPLDGFYREACPPLGNVLQNLMRENKCKPLSAPGPDEIGWSKLGIADGRRDYELNPGIDNGPAWLPMVKQRATIYVPPECR